MSASLRFADDAVKLVEIVADRAVSNTQSIKTLIIEKNGRKYVALQKWWRESADVPWREGKGFHLSPDDVRSMVSDLEAALEHLRVDD